MLGRIGGAVIWDTLGRPVDRLAHALPSAPVRYAAALVTVGSAAAVVESHLVAFGHGTHLLVLLIAGIGTALYLGPGPGAVALVVGGAGSTVASVVLPDAAAGTAEIALQFLTYLLVGSAFVVLVGVAIRTASRASPGLSLARPSPLGTQVPPTSRNPVEPLTARERDVLCMAATGMTVDDIARSLFVSPNTVKTHLGHIYGKLDARSRAEAFGAALHCGCLHPIDLFPDLADEGQAPSAESPVRVTGESREQVMSAHRARSSM